MLLAIPLGMAVFSQMMVENANVTGQSAAVQPLFNELPTIFFLLFGGVIILLVVGAVAFFMRQ